MKVACCDTVELFAVIPLSKAIITAIEDQFLSAELCPPYAVRSSASGII